MVTPPAHKGPPADDDANRQAVLASLRLAIFKLSDSGAKTRDIAMTITKLDEAIMWLNRSLSKDGVPHE